MTDNILDKIYKILVFLSVIMTVIFIVFIIGHGSMLIYERIKEPDKSKERWRQIEEKFNLVPADESTFYLHL